MTIIDVSTNWLMDRPQAPRSSGTIHFPLSSQALLSQVWMNEKMYWCMTGLTCLYVYNRRLNKLTHGQTTGSKELSSDPFSTFFSGITESDMNMNKLMYLLITWTICLADSLINWLTCSISWLHKLIMGSKELSDDPSSTLCSSITESGMNECNNAMDDLTDPDWPLRHLLLLLISYGFRRKTGKTRKQPILQRRVLYHRPRGGKGTQGGNFSRQGNSFPEYSRIQFSELWSPSNNMAIFNLRKPQCLFCLICTHFFLWFIEK